MAHFELWKLSVDVLLMASLCVLCVRLLKGGGAANRNPRAQELEGSLRSLIREADDAGRSLNDELQRRQRDLDRLLRELQGVESSARKVFQTSKEAPASRVPSGMAYAPPPSQGTLSDRVERTVEPRSFRTASPTSSPTPPQSAPRQEAAPKTQTRATRVNIYGETIEETPVFQHAPSANVRPAATQSGYAAQIARPVVPQPRPAAQKPLVNSIEQTVTVSSEIDAAGDVYRAAEDLLRAGKELAFVAAATRLPMDEVKVLSRVVSQQIIAKSSEGIVAERVLAPETPHVRTADPRLGVLNTMRRQVQTL